MKILSIGPFKAASEIILTCTLLLLFTVGGANAQTVTDGSTPLGISPGAPEGSYALSDLDTVNLYNGGLSFRLPLVKISGRGGASYTMVARIEHKWLVSKEQELGVPNRYVPNPNWWNPDELGVLYSMGGIHLRKAYSWPIGTYLATLSRLTFTAPDGTEYELRDQLTNGRPDYPTGTGRLNRGRIFTTSDGSNAVFTAQADIVDGPQMDEYVSGYLVQRDGTTYRIDNSLMTWMRDRNGNKLTFAYDSFRRLSTVNDSLNRQVTISYANGATTYDQITLKGFGGAQRVIKVYQSVLQNALRSDFSVLNYPQLFPELNGAGGTGYLPVISAVELPNGQQYQFQYNSFAELARVVLPTGGAMEYDYAAGLTNGAADGVIAIANPYPGKEIYRRVVERRVYPNGGSGATYASRMTYSRPETTTTNLGYVTTDQYSSSGTLLGRSNHYFYGSPRLSFNQQPAQYAGWKDGKEYQTVVYAANGTTALKQVNTTFAQRTAVSWWGGAADQEPPSDTRPTESSSTLVDTNQVSKQTFGYDDTVPYNNQNNVKEYDYGSGAAGALIRETRTTFTTAAGYLNVSLLSLPSQVSIYDGGGTERGRATYEYDNYTPDTSHYSLIPRSSISGFDSSFDTTYALRGNPTATTHYLLNSSGQVTDSISSYAQYDIAGNVVKTIDARGSATTFDFGDRFGAPGTEARANTSPTELSSPGQVSYAFPTLVTNALGQTSYLQFDFYLGRPVNAEDANGVVFAGYSDGDPLDRPTKVIRAANQSNAIKSQTIYSYDDVNHVITTTRDQTGFDDLTPLKSQIVYDGLGHTIESRSYENSTQYIAVQQVPFVMMQNPDTGAWLQARQSSNPFRPYLSEQPIWTTTFADALGRVSKTRTPDNAIIRTSYSGDTVTVTDQAGKTRKSVTDGLGRLTSVYEDPSGLNYQTSYAFDTLNNLTTVTQGVQTRTFVYDSIKRLTAATNPESGTVSYDYDSNGNLLHKTDARSTTTAFAYDALNRATSRSYNDSPQTPTVNYFYDSQTLPSGAPSLDRGYAAGRLVAVTYGSSSSAGTYRGYDQMGSVIRQYQQTDSVNYLVEATYYANGSMLNETYPSVPGSSDRRTVSYTNDAAGRLASLSSSATTYSPAASVSSIGYASHNALNTETYGNSLIHAVSYNNRLQPSEIKLGTSGNPTSVVDLTYSYGTTNNNGNVQSIGYSGGGLSYTQSFGYDQLNRLTTSNENSGSSWSQTNAYDRYGNRWIDLGGGNQSLYLNTTNNRISGWSYDSAGNLLNDGVHVYTFDAENKISKVDTVSAYVYDGEGQRVRKFVGENLRFIYGIGGKEIAEFDGSSGALEKEYIHGASGLISTIEPTAVNSNGTRYTTSDHLGSPRVVTNSSASVVSRHDYMPFGDELGSGIGGRTTGMGFGITDGQRQKFTSKERDIETGLDYFLARYYSSTQGRFTSPDPIIISDKQVANPQSWNLYGYVNNNPLANLDPTGMERVKLGQHTDDQIDETIKKNNQKKKDIDKDKSLSKDDKKQQKKALDAQNHTLNLEKEGNRIANQMLEDLDSIGERQNLQVSDFTLTTDASNDFSGVSGLASPPVTGRANMFVLQGYSQEIFIDTHAQLYQGMQNGSSTAEVEDYITYGGTVAVHERSHRDSKTLAERLSEPRAYTEQLRVLQRFGPTAFKSRTFYYDRLRTVGASTQP